MFNEEELAALDRALDKIYRDRPVPFRHQMVLDELAGALDAAGVYRFYIRRKRGRPAGLRSEPYGPREPARVQEMRDLRAAGMTLAAIGKVFDVSRQCIEQHLYPERVRSRQRRPTAAGGSDD